VDWVRIIRQVAVVYLHMLGRWAEYDLLSQAKVVLEKQILI
jgi:hypothetical protein